MPGTTAPLTLRSLALQKSGCVASRQRGPVLQRASKVPGIALPTTSATSAILGAVGFCFGRGMANTLAVRLPDLIRAAVPFYGGQPAAAEVPKIKAAILLQFAENDERVNAGWPAYEEALKKAGVRYTAHHYPGTNHGFYNDTTPRYDEAAAKLAWQRTLEFFNKELGGK